MTKKTLILSQTVKCKVLETIEHTRNKKVELACGVVGRNGRNGEMDWIEEGGGEGVQKEKC